jgi:putative ABC transport system permease protein
MLKSVWRMNRTSLGFDSRNVLTLLLNYGRSFDHNAAKRATFEQSLLVQVRAMPGVERAGFTSDLPFASGSVIGFQLPGDSRPHWSEVYVADPGYLSVLGLPMVRGRPLSSGDTERSARVAVINQALAERFFPGSDPLGQRLILKDPHEIVGVVTNHGEMFRRSDDWRAGLRSMLRKDEDVQMIKALSPPAVYVPSGQVDWAGWLQYLVVRTSAHPGALVTPLRRAVASLDPAVSVKEAATFDEWMGMTSEAPRFYAVVLMVFSLAAFVLAAVGMYGVLAHSVGQRVHEIGVRIALGAEPAAVRRLVVLQIIPALAIGLSAGLALASAATNMMRHFLFEVAPTDTWTLASVALVFVAVALAACYLPARRASNLDPMNALRCE